MRTALLLLWAVTVLSMHAASGTAEEDATEALGSPVASSLASQVKQEIESGIKTRSLEGTFRQFRSYGAGKLDSTAGPVQTSEVTGNCRLSWYDQMYRNPLDAPVEAEQFTRQLHKAIRAGHRGLAEVLATGRAKMDLGRRDGHVPASPKTPQEALEMVKQALARAQAGYAAALAPLTRRELFELTSNLYPIMTSQNREGHTLVDRGSGRRLTDLMEKANRGAFFDAAEALVPLADEQLLKQLAAFPAEGGATVEGAGGSIVARIDTAGGTIVIGGKGKNTYDLEKMDGVNVVIDLGGDDTYKEGTANFHRPVMIVIDLDGDDRYEGTQPGIQGGALVGIGMLVDVAGNDVYQAQDLAQGSARFGVGMLVDLAGTDRYVGVRRVQGHALGGVGLLVDRAGHDSYHAAMWDQGFGAPLGFAVLDDLEGNDEYYTGGLYPDSYPETPGYEGWGQGVGTGLRQVANGGIGVILDGGGDDLYEYDYISHGGGYWLGLGFARDFAGKDRRLGGTQKEYSGGARREPMFQRFSCGFGCHYAQGFCIDDAGDDTYGGTIMGLGMGWDMSMGFLCDFGGNDRYEATGGSTEGNGAQASLGVLFDYTGNDVYVGYNQGFASPSISYHPLPQCGGNFSYLIDYGGKDSYGCGAHDNTYNRAVRPADSSSIVRSREKRPARKRTNRRPPSPLPPRAGRSKTSSCPHGTQCLPRRGRLARRRAEQVLRRRAAPAEITWKTIWRLEGAFPCLACE